MAIKLHWFGGVFIGSYTETANGLLEKDGIEQVGFVQAEQREPSFVDFYEPRMEKLVMMGGELCINATLAYAASIGARSGELRITDDTMVQFENKDGVTTIELNLSNKVFMSKYFTKMIIFDAIGYEVGMSMREAVDRQDQLPKLCAEYGLPAFGFIVCDKQGIRPLIYVQGMDSCIWETACGSGSVATLLARKELELPVTQPTGQVITVTDCGNQRYKIATNVEQI